MAQTTMAINLAGIVPVGHEDLNSDSSTQRAKPGSYAFMLDGFGPRIFRYGQNRSTSTLGLGSLASRVGDNNGATSAGTLASPFATTHVGTSGLTANKHVGSIFYVTDDAGAAGAAPEGESTIVAANTATLINFDRSMPLSTALAASDTASMLGTYNIEASASGDLTWVVFGVVLGSSGIAAANYGWAQSWGMCPNAIATTAAVTVNKPLIAGTGTVVSGGATSAFNTVIGYAPIGAAADLADPFKTLVFMTLDFGFVPADTDANVA